MREELDQIGALRRVLESGRGGRGVARACIDEFRSKGGRGGEVARRLLLGHSISESLGMLVRGPSEEVGMLASLVVESVRSSPQAVGEGGEGLASTLEKWVMVAEGKKLENRVQETRGLLASAILGAVASMLASLGPVVGSLSFTGQAQPAPALALTVAAGAMAADGAAMLGMYLSGRRFLLNVVACLASFAVVGLMAAPLQDFSGAGPWGG